MEVLEHPRDQESDEDDERVDGERAEGAAGGGVFELGEDGEQVGLVEEGVDEESEGGLDVVVRSSVELDVLEAAHWEVGECDRDHC